MGGFSINTEFVKYLVVELDIDSYLEMLERLDLVASAVINRKKTAKDGKDTTTEDDLVEELANG